MLVKERVWKTKDEGNSFLNPLCGLPYLGFFFTGACIFNAKCSVYLSFMPFIDFFFKLPCITLTNCVANTVFYE